MTLAPWRLDREEPALGRQIPALDGIRGLAIALVMVSHFIVIHPTGALASRVVSVLASGGVTGVQLFFVLSGFLITGILYDSKGAEFYFRNFYIRRALRIFPLYYGFLVVLFVVLPLVYGRGGPELRTLLAHQGWYWAYLTNFLIAVKGTQAAAPLGTHHFWSLAVEEQFYLAWPLVVWACGRRTLLRVCAALVVGVLMLRVALLAAGVSHIAVAEMTFTRIDALATGAFVAVAMRGRGGAERLFRAAWPVLAGSAVVLAFVFLGHSGGANAALATVGYSALALAFAALLVVAVTAPAGSLRQRAATLPLLTMLGRYSYALYVFHLPLQELLARSGLVRYDTFVARTGSPVAAQLLVFVTLSGLSMALAWVSWHLYEKQFLKLKDRFPYEGKRARHESTERELHAEADALAAP